MNAATFFMDNFGVHLLGLGINGVLERSEDPWEDMRIVLSGNYLVNSKNPKTIAGGKAVRSRLQSGWAIIRPGSATLQLDLVVNGIQKSTLTRKAAYELECATWNGKEPRIFLEFDKLPMNEKQVFLSLDKRHVWVCNKSGGAIQNWVSNPPTK